MTNVKRYPQVGVGVMILKDGKALLSRRRGSHGPGEYAFPGGHLDYMESFEDCARREIREETGIEIKNVRFQFLANVKRYTPKHYVHVGLVAYWASGEPKTLEPDKSEGGWNWHSIQKPPKPLFEMCRLAFVSKKSKKIYFDL